MDEVAINYKKFRHSYLDLNMIFGDIEEVEEEEDSVKFYESSIDRVSIEEEEDENASINSDERRTFWESQEQLLQATLYRTTSFETKVRKATKDALRDHLNSGGGCSCRSTTAAAAGCRRCRLKEVCFQLQKAGFNCVICISNWKTTPDITAGQHTYLEITAGSKKGETKVIIELNFKAEFEMGRSNQEYQHLVTKLPDVYVGKIERLRNLVKILCGASKKCMKENQMYLAPWRKHNYMQAKWRLQPPLSVVVERRLPPPQNRRASMLNFDFIDTTLYQNHAVEVI